MDMEKFYFMNGGKFTKMEMVCKALQQCTMPSDLEGYETQCGDCPYFDLDCSVSVCKQQLCDDAIALLNEQQEQIDRLLEESASNAEMAEGYAELLKEQETVKPHYNARTNWYECGACHYSMTSGMHCRGELIPAYKVGFCAKCGKAVKWNG